MVNLRMYQIDRHRVIKFNDHSIVHKGNYGSLNVCIVSVFIHLDAFEQDSKTLKHT